jgi:hypothetical protein
MPAHDKYHKAVRHALEKDGWTITHDPYKILIENWRPEYQIDFGAEKSYIAAEKDKEKIAVEVKSFISHSLAYEFHRAIGQYLTYALGVRLLEPERVLYLAMPEKAYQVLETSNLQKMVLQEYHIKVIVFNEKEEIIAQWKKY